jgi:hypothetical protein
MAEVMFVKMPAALLLGTLAGWLTRRRIPVQAREVLSIAALVMASIVMPFWMLPVMMDRAAAFPAYGVARDLTLALTGAAIVVCHSTWAPVIRHLWVLEQVALLVRYAIWYGFAAVALCTAWDADAQLVAGSGLLAMSLLVAAGYALFWWRGSRRTTSGHPASRPL